MFPGWIRELCVVSGAHLFVLSVDAQTGLELAGARNCTKFSQCNWCGEAFHRLEVQDVKSLILLMLYFHLMEEGEEEARKKTKKKICHHVGRRVSLVLDLSCWLCSGLQRLGPIKG
jgi:hypothetical protein